MKKKKLLQVLKTYLSDYHYSLIRLGLTIEGDITFCSSVTDIIKEYNSTEDNEAQVSAILSQLCKEHFKNVK